MLRTDTLPVVVLKLRSRSEKEKAMIKKIGIVLENLECFWISAKHIKSLMLSDIVECIYAAPYEEILMRHKKSKNVFLVLHAEGDRPHDGNFASWFDRIHQCKDIVMFDLYYDDGSHEEIHVESSDASIIVNEYQTSERNEKGDLSVRISQKK